MSLRTSLRTALEDLAGSPEQQRRRLQEIGTYPSLDELALELDALAPAAWQLVESGDISEETYAAMLNLNERLGEFSGEANTSEWQVDALRTSANWADVCVQARRILALLLAI